MDSDLEWSREVSPEVGHERSPPIVDKRVGELRHLRKAASLDHRFSAAGGGHGNKPPYHPKYSTLPTNVDVSPGIQRRERSHHVLITDGASAVAVGRGVPHHDLDDEEAMYA